ncbi:zinc finger protein 581 [Dipodomys spectabilis]|uniref:zinc finger protein 581 n=1 Tax=Dipodomys spectabilis TaxID=105255 RepID=UPI001C53599E|nr:zinc finger protein 581 [Dipodomys spectabilis]
MPAAAAASPRPVSPSRPRRYLLIDTQGVPYTALVDDQARRAAAAPGSAGQKKSYRCPVCSRAFEYQSYLQRHSVAHSEAKPFRCDACGKAFKRASHLARHRGTHRAGVGRPLGCPRRFRDAGEPARRDRAHSEECPLQCPRCPRRFTEQSTRQKHRRWKHP